MIDKRFVLFKKVARGGMAEIFLGKLIGEDGFERVCCFKRILPHFSVEKEFIEMFRDEAHIGKRLQHPNIVRVEGFEEVDGAYAIIMEFVNGSDLRGIITACASEKIRIPIPFAVHVIAEAARGLHYAHIKKDDITQKPLGIVHRDISPQNILVSFEGEVKVTDFGIAEADSKLTETKTGIVKGKFSYMSPEQISAEPVDARTDVFALSIILWEMLTGRRLFHSDNEVVIIQMVRDCIIPDDIRSYNPDIDEELEKIINRGLKKNLLDRYESALQFEKELRLYLSRRHPGYSSDDVSDFLRKLLNDKRDSLANDIKELLSSKENGTSKPSMEIDLRQESKAAPLDKSEVSKLRPVKTSVGSLPTGIHSLPPLQTKASPIYEGTRRGSVSPRTGGTQRKYVKRQSTGSKTIQLIVALSVFVLLVGGATVFYISKKKFLSSSATWTITTVPDTTKITLDGHPLNGGSYMKSPNVLKELFPGIHSVVVSRPGFESSSVAVNMATQKSPESTIILKQVAQMAPLRLSLKVAVPPLRFSLDNGLVEDQLSFEEPKNLSYVTFGFEHTLRFETSDKAIFECQFTPRAQTKDAPFLVVINPTTKKCSYPLR